MRYSLQAVIIAAVTFAAELIKYFVPLPVPASIYGLLLLFALLKSGILKLEQIEGVVVANQYADLADDEGVIASDKM